MSRSRKPSPAAAAVRLHGRTLTEVGAHVGLDLSTVSHILAGRRNPPPGFADALAELVGMDGAKMITGLIPPYNRPDRPRRVEVVAA
jgi:transcriptional regulator with XRE-family HTH domain